MPCNPIPPWARAVIAGALDSTELAPRPAAPTDTFPGTPEKEEVLRQRVERREQLHHPDDPTITTVLWMGFEIQVEPNGRVVYKRPVDERRRGEEAS